jgi:hypothetical protein
VGPQIEFAPEGDASRLAQVYMLRDAQNLYFAFLINDDTPDATDSVRLYLDTINNDGDPDSSDRFFQVGRDGTVAIAAGIGSNSDTQEWNAGYTSDNWSAAISGPSGSQWGVEMQIDLDAELGNALSDPFGMMMQVLYTGEMLAPWPPGATTNALGTWQSVDNVTCP